jgi:hypothetical protein
MRLFFTDEKPATGWLISRTDGEFAAEELNGPRRLTAASLPALLTLLSQDEADLRRRYTEEQVRQAATAVSCDPDALATRLRSMV